MATLQATILVVLDQMVVGVPREGEWIEPERIDDWSLQNAQITAALLQVFGIELDEVVADDKVGIRGKRVHLF